MIDLDKSTSRLKDEIETELKKLESSDDEVVKLQLKQLREKFSDSTKKFDEIHKAVTEKEIVYIEEDETFEKEKIAAAKEGKVIGKSSLMRNEYEEQLRDAKERDENLKNLEKDGVQVHGLMKVRYIK